ncbi:LOW QUALITY PROTEIN: LIM and calponin homology domains-containing protein 1-like [Aplochiton taeniatus]
MASPAADTEQPHQHHCLSDSATDSAVLEAQKWIEAVTGRGFGDKDLRAGLENGILLCELLSSIKPGLVKKINRLPTPVAGLDNLSVFLRGCEELGLKGSQLFDPGDLQDTSTHPNPRPADCSRRLKNVLITVYWLGRAANSCTSYNGPTLDLREFQGLLVQMRKEAEDSESPKRSIRDSGYIDCWDSERSDSLSPPRHGREDSFDSLDSFGSRSQQTPSPDVPLARPSSDGRGSDSESDAPHRKLPDVRKDDMLARRTSVSEPRVVLPFNQYLPNKSNQSAYLPTPLRKKRSDRDEGGRKSWSTATSPIGGDRPFSSPARSCSEEHFLVAAVATPTSMGVTNPLCPSPDTSRKYPGKEKGEAPKMRGGAIVSGASRDDMWARRTLAALKLATTPSCTNFLPVPAAAATATIVVSANQSRQMGRALSESDRPQRRLSWLDDDLPPTFSHRASVSDDSESVSMIDMRGDDDAFLQPHSQVRHEMMHNQYNQMKEEEDHWQDDLARWKSRRRSVSQDLIKKEEERKMMEQLMTGGGPSSQRRKSIKTYREIVEEKERREDELRDAYRRASTPEQAALVLQRYAQRFTISEAVLERLQLPKLLDRSVSADPSLAYPPISLSPTPTSPQPHPADPHGPMRHLRQESTPAPKFTATVEARVEEFTLDPAPSLPSSSSSSSPHPTDHRPQIRSRSSEPSSAPRALSPKPRPVLSPKPYMQPQGLKPGKVEGLSRINGETGCDDAASTPDSETGSTSSLRLNPASAKTPYPNSDAPGSTVSPSPPRSTTPSSPSRCPNGPYQVPPLTPEALIQARQANRRSWDPDEERKRQERWQREQERMLQEKYIREQEKLKEEWERAQREVVEEERKYHEEERQILEETVAPPDPPAPLLPSPSQSDLSPPFDPQDTIVRSLADWERKQELLERQSQGSVEIAESGRSRTSDISTADDSMRTGKSLLSSQSETVSHSQQNGQRLPPVDQPKAQEHTQNQTQIRTQNPGKKQQEVLLDCTKPGRSAGDRRCGAIDDNYVGHSPRKPPSPACTSSDTQPQSPSRSVSGKKLCSSCGQPLGKGAAMIIETLSLYFHIQCFKCGVCKGQLGDTTTGTDVRIRNGLLNCHQCYIRSRSAGQPTTL